MNGTDDRARWLLYGAYGYTGRLIARRAVERGETPVLAGRDASRLVTLADTLGLEHRAVALGEPAGLDAALDDVDAVLHVAGPFVDTYRPMADACLRTGTHYLDVTGEIGVIEGLASMGPRAAAVGIVLLPAVGYDVVPTDCVAAAAAAAVEDADHLELAFHSTGGASRGTARVAVRGLGDPSRERRGGQLVAFRHGSITRTIPFTDRPRRGMAIPWGDIATAYRSTGIPNIRVYTTARPGTIRLVRVLGYLRPLLASWPVARLAHWWVDRNVKGPDEATLRSSTTRIWGRAWNATGDEAQLELVTPNAYALTADAAVRAVATLLDASYAGPGSGFLTPSLAFGAGFVDRLEGTEWVKREDG